jgi:tripartite-type tricarboxylate transporter receptor subunit TctC
MAANNKRARRWLTAKALGIILAGLGLTGQLRADEYPSRPITLLVPFAAGGSSDSVMRIVARKASESMKQTIIIENKPGGGGNVAALAIKHAPPDGYLLMMGHSGTHAVNPLLYTDLKFDPVKDFQPVAALISFNNILVVPESSPARSVAELVALAKSKPDGASFASQGIGTMGHLLGETLARQTGAKLVHVPYRGVAPALTDLVAGRVDMMFSSYISAAGHIQSGKLRMLAIAGAHRNERIADIPTMAEAGYPNVDFEQWFGVFAPAGTPKPIVEKLNAEFTKALRSDDVKTMVLSQAATIIPGTSEDLDALVQRDIIRLGKVVKDSGATIQ